MGLRAMFVVSEILMPIILGHIINLITAGQASWNEIMVWAAIFCLQTLLHPPIEVFTANRAWIYAKKVGQDFRQDAASLLKHSGLNFWQNKSKGSVMKVIDQAVEDITNFSAAISHIYLWWGGRALGIFLASTFFDPVILVIYVVDLIIFAINLKIMIPKEQKLGVIENKGKENVTGRIMEYLNNFKTVVYLNLYQKQEKEIAYYNQQEYERFRRREFVTSWKWYNNNQLHNITVLLVFSYSLYLVMIGQFIVGTMTTIVFFAIRFADDVGAMVWQTEQFVSYVNGMQRYHETFGNIKPNPQDLIPSVTIDFESLSINNVSLQRSDRETLKNVSFYLKKDLL